MIVYRQHYKPGTLIRASLKSIGFEEGLLSLPLFAVSETTRLLSCLD
jgi:hypothetical protein